MKVADVMPNVNAAESPKRIHHPADRGGRGAESACVTGDRAYVITPAYQTRIMLI